MMRKLGHKYLDELGIDDEDIRELAGISTQKEFAERYNIRPQTLTVWKRETPPPEYADIDWRIWTRHLTREVVHQLWLGISKRKDPASVKLFMQLAGEYEETTHIKVDGTQELFDGLRQIAEHLNQTGDTDDHT